MSKQQKCDNCGTMLPNTSYTELGNGYVICATCISKLQEAESTEQEVCEVIPRDSSQIKSVLGAGRMLLSSVRDGIPVVLSNAMPAARSAGNSASRKPKVDRGPALMPMPSANAAATAEVSTCLPPSQVVLQRNEELKARRRLQQAAEAQAGTAAPTAAMSMSDKDRMLKLLLRERKALKLRVAKLESHSLSLEKTVAEKLEEVTQAQEHIVQLRSRVSGVGESFVCDSPRDNREPVDDAELQSQQAEPLEDLQLLDTLSDGLSVADVSFTVDELPDPEQEKVESDSEEVASADELFENPEQGFVSRDISCIWNRYEPTLNSGSTSPIAHSEQDRQAMEDAALYAGVDWAQLSLKRDAQDRVSPEETESESEDAMFGERESQLNRGVEELDAPRHSMPFVNGGRE